MPPNLLFIIGAMAFLVLGGGTAIFVQKFNTRKEFYDALLPEALQLQKETGIDPKITLAQAAHESNFGKSELSSQYHNLFGIKPGSSWTGQIARFNTNEFINGQKVVVAAEFRAYPSYLASMRDWSSLLARLYPAALAAGQKGDINGFADGLMKGKAGAYATDPKYKVALVGVRNSLDALA